jgi:type IV fimbrial biogenesis protein FimT
MARVPMMRAREAGFTLVELVLVMSIAGVLATIATFGFSNWRLTAEEQGSAQTVVSQLRNTAEAAISEGRTYCVDLDSANRSYTVYRYTCDGSAANKVSGVRKTQSSRVTFTSVVSVPTSAPTCPASHACLYFYPRGTAIPATITVASTKRSKTYVIHVEGLTARVYI